MAYAAHDFNLNKRDSKGVSLREKLEHIEETTGKRPRELDGPGFPESGAYLWNWFSELSNSRGSSGFGPNPISFLEIDAWSRMMHTKIWPHEIKIIQALDRVYISTYASKKES